MKNILTALKLTLATPLFVAGVIVGLILGPFKAGMEAGDLFWDE